MGKIEFAWGGLGVIPQINVVLHGVSMEYLTKTTQESEKSCEYHVKGSGRHWAQQMEGDYIYNIQGNRFMCIVQPYFLKDGPMWGYADRWRWGDFIYNIRRDTKQLSGGGAFDVTETGNAGSLYNYIQIMTDTPNYSKQWDDDDTILEVPSELDFENVLVFESQAALEEFATKWQGGELDTSLILNFGEDSHQQDFETSKQYYFSCSWNIFEKDETGLYSQRVNSGATKVVFNSTDKRLYFTGLNDIDRNLVLKNYSGVPCDYSTVHGWKIWNSASTMPSDLEKVVNGKLKIDNNHIISGVLTTNIPIFTNNQKGQEYEHENIEADQADNGDKLSKDDYSPVTKEITSGNAETETVLGSGVAMDKMTMFYKLNSSQLASFGATLFRSENLDSIVAGTKLVGQDALNSIIGLRFYPFDISSVCTTTGTYGIILGSWVSGVLSSGVITSNNGKINMGETMIEPVFNNFLDYTNIGLSIYLPYIGIRTIDIKNVLGKTLKVEYLVDITTGKCKAMLFANGLLFDSHEGVIARDCPISGTDAQSYNASNRNAQMAMTDARLSGFGAIMGAVGGSGGIGGGYDKSGQFATSPSVGVGVSTQGIASAVNFAANYGNMMDRAEQEKVNARNNLPTYFSGSSGGQLGELEPQYIYLIFTVNKTHLPQNERNLVGLPSNTSGTVSQFYGFLSCDVSKFETMASTTEKNMILQLLANGIYI